MKQCERAGGTPNRISKPICCGGEGMDYRKLITIEPGKRAGKPCIRGMRITVYDVLDYLASGMTHQEILDEFPYLREEDILACLSYAADRERSTLAVMG